MQSPTFSAPRIYTLQISHRTNRYYIYHMYHMYPFTPHRRGSKSYQMLPAIPEVDKVPQTLVFQPFHYRSHLSNTIKTQRMTEALTTRLLCLASVRTSTTMTIEEKEQRRSNIRQNLAKILKDEKRGEDKKLKGGNIWCRGGLRGCGGQGWDGDSNVGRRSVWKNLCSR